MANNKYKSAQFAVNKLLSILKMKDNYAQYLSGEHQIIVVEGSTDERFVKPILSENTLCEVANNIGLNKRSDKKVIVDLLDVLQNYQLLLDSDIPKDFFSCKIYGMVDLDNDDIKDKTYSLERIFVTDTHDLETLLLCTDDGLLQRCDGFLISEDELKKAYCLAYQLAIVRQVLFDVVDAGFVKPISGSSDNIDFDSFINNYRISVEDLIKYLSKESDSSVSKKQKESIMRNKALKKRLDEQGYVNLDWEVFNPDDYLDFWQIINGHSILALIRHLNKAAAEKYDNKGYYSLNRNFEFELIEKYEYQNFYGTKMAEKMKSCEVIKEQ